MTQLCLNPPCSTSVWWRSQVNLKRFRHLCCMQVSIWPSCKSGWLALSSSLPTGPAVRNLQTLLRALDIFAASQYLTLMHGWLLCPLLSQMTQLCNLNPVAQQSNNQHTPGQELILLISSGHDCYWWLMLIISLLCHILHCPPLSQLTQLCNLNPLSQHLPVGQERVNLMSPTPISGSWP